jgi:hypothetical protein
LTGLAAVLQQAGGGVAPAARSKTGQAKRLPLFVDGASICPVGAGPIAPHARCRLATSVLTPCHGAASLARWSWTLQPLPGWPPCPQRNRPALGRGSGYPPFPEPFYLDAASGGLTW